MPTRRQKVKLKRRPADRRRIETHALTIQATSATDRASASIERLKGGDITWTVRAPRTTLREAVRDVIRNVRLVAKEAERLESEELARKLTPREKEGGGR